MTMSTSTECLEGKHEDCTIGGYCVCPHHERMDKQWEIDDAAAESKLQENAQVVAEHLEGMRIECRMCRGTGLVWVNIGLPKKRCSPCKGSGYRCSTDLNTLLIEMDKEGWYMKIAVGFKGNPTVEVYHPSAGHKATEYEGSTVGLVGKASAEDPTEAAFSAAAQCFSKVAV